MAFITMHRRPFALAALSLTTAALFAGCGSASKPAYCKQVSEFHSSVSALEKEEISITNATAVLGAVEKVGTSAKALGSAVKGEFAPQISAIDSSLGAVGKSLGEVTGGSLSAAKQIPTEIDKLKQAASEIQQVTKTKCE